MAMPERFLCRKILKTPFAFSPNIPTRGSSRGRPILASNIITADKSQPTLLCLSDLDDLRKIEIGKETVVIGAGVTWTDVLESTDELFAEFADVLLRFGSPQIRNIGSIGGNLANASPIADSIPFLYAAGAELELLSDRGVRIVPIEKFYRGYKQIDLQPGELIRAVRVPRIRGNETLKLYKVSRRRDMDISTFTAAVLLTLERQSSRLRAYRVWRCRPHRDSSETDGSVSGGTGVQRRFRASGGFDCSQRNDAHLGCTRQRRLSLSIGGERANEVLS